MARSIQDGNVDWTEAADGRNSLRVVKTTVRQQQIAGIYTYLMANIVVKARSVVVIVDGPGAPNSQNTPKGMRRVVKSVTANCIRRLRRVATARTVIMKLKAAIGIPANIP